MKALECSHSFSHCMSMGIFSDAQGKLTPRIWPKFELIQAFMVVLLTCKNEEGPIKNESARVVTTLYINFSDALWQITPELAVGSGRNLNSLKLSYMSSLPARMKMIHSKMNGLGWSQHFSHYKSMGMFPDPQGQLTPQSLVRSVPIWSQDFPIITLWELSVAMETRVLIRSGPKPNAAFPPPQ